MTRWCRPARAARLVLMMALMPSPLFAQSDQAAGQLAAVLEVLQAPQRGTMVELARARGAALAALSFDGIPLAADFLDDADLGSDAAYAILGADETRGLTVLLESIPQSGPNIQRIAFTWFLDRYDALPPDLDEPARTAAHRTLEPVRSTANAEAALYVLGLTGSKSDQSVLEFHLVNFRTGSRGMRDASHAALLRIGSDAHLEKLRAELSKPLDSGATYEQGLQLALALQKAAFSGREELVPAVCSHLQDQPLGGIEFRVDPGRSARLALNAIVDHVAVTHLASGARSTEGWLSYCAGLSR